MESEFGRIASLRPRFETDPAFARYRTGEMEASIETDKVWEAFIRLDERRARRRELLEAHPKKDAPSSHEDGTPCVICNMTGKDEWTANPDMKWDWWKIDGHWMRELRGNSTAGDGSEKETPCPYCEGTGKRFTAGCLPPKSIEARRSPAASERSAATEADPVVECDACGGTGTNPAAAQAALAGEIVPLGDVAENLKAHPPAALLTADGAWHPHGEDLCCFRQLQRAVRAPDTPERMEDNGGRHHGPTPGSGHRLREMPHLLKTDPVPPRNAKTPVRRSLTDRHTWQLRCTDIPCSARPFASQTALQPFPMRFGGC